MGDKIQSLCKNVFQNKFGLLKPQINFGVHFCLKGKVPGFKCQIMRWKGDKYCWKNLAVHIFSQHNILSRIAIPHLPTSCQKWISRLSSSPAYPAAPHEQSPSVYLEDRCFDDHLPPVDLWIHLPLRLLSHLQLQSCLLTYKDHFHLTYFDSWLSAFGYQVCDSMLYFLVLSATLYLLPSCVTFQRWALAVSVLGGARPPCEGDNDCYHECEEAEQTVGIYYRAKRIREGTGDERNSMP